MRPHELGQRPPDLTARGRSLASMQVQQKADTNAEEIVIASVLIRGCSHHGTVRRRAAGDAGNDQWLAFPS
jgi:hypothetical protein